MVDEVMPSMGDEVMPSMGDEDKPSMPGLPDYGNYDDFGNYDGGLLYEDPPTIDWDYDNQDDSADKDPTMYFDEITTTTVSPDMYDYLFAFAKPSRHRIKGPVRKKFDAQSLKDAYAAILQKAKDQKTSQRVTRSVLDEAEAIARQFLQRITGPKPKVFGLLDRRAPPVFRANSFVRISLSQFSIVSTGATGMNSYFLMLKFRFSDDFFASKIKNFTQKRPT
jgi:hypothetical protein